EAPQPAFLLRVRPLSTQKKKHGTKRCRASSNATVSASAVAGAGSIRSPTRVELETPICGTLVAIDVHAARSAAGLEDLLVGDVVAEQRRVPVALGRGERQTRAELGVRLLIARRRRRAFNRAAVVVVVLRVDVQPWR